MTVIFSGSSENIRAATAFVSRRPMNP